ncbi:MAG TPA: amidohydrolase family protein [Aggregatilineaceae bacterium]|nr:amidohydrolase family protein [Aggregatilineaceae bacterium]
MSSVRLPGLVDPHVHLREPGGEHKEDFESGTRAALAGGVTMVLAMPNTLPPLVDAASLGLAEAAARKKAVCDYGLHLGGSSANGETAAALADRVTGLKLYLDVTYGPLHIKDLGALREHLARWPKDRPVLCHAEERTMAAVLMIAHLENRRVHICHVSRKAEIELIRDARMRGIDVTCEVTPHHLFLTEDDIPNFPRPGRAEVRPRLASKADQDALWANMEFIDCIASDHAPHTLAEKDGENPPPGFPGLETSLALMLTAVHDGRIDLDAVVARMADNPRRLFNLPEQPDTWIEVDPDATWTARNEDMITRCAWTPFAGAVLRGRVQKVTLRGQRVLEDGQFFVQPGTGRNLAPACRSVIMT